MVNQAMAHEYGYWNGGRSDGGYTDGGYTTHNGPREEEWRKGAGNGHADHVCRPVIVDAMGRKRPIVCFNPISNTETYVAQTETIVFRTPAVTEYRFSAPGRVGEHKHSYPVREEEYKLGSPGRVDEQKYSYPVRVEEYKHGSPGRVDEHKYSYPVRVEYKPSSPGKVDEHKYSHPVRVEEYKHSPPANRWGRPSSPVHDRPPEVEQFITKIQTEVSEVPTRHGPLTAMNWRQHHNPPKALNGTGGYGEYGNYGKDDYWNKPNSNIIIRSDPSDGDDDYYHRNDGTKEPTITNSNGWGGRPKQAEWATPPGSKLTRPTSDIGAAVEILKEAAMPSSGQPVRFSTPAPTVPKYAETIDSKEAARRYGNFKPTPRPDLTGGTIIDSKTAQEKYKGAKV